MKFIGLRIDSIPINLAYNDYIFGYFDFDFDFDLGFDLDLGLDITSSVV